MEKLKDLPTIEQKEKEDYQKAKKIERINGVLMCDGWEDVKEILLKEANSDKLMKLLGEIRTTNFEEIGQLTYIDAKANDKVKQGIRNVEKYKG